MFRVRFFISLDGHNSAMGRPRAKAPVGGVQVFKVTNVPANPLLALALACRRGERPE
jgi:hypothetical protein